MLDIKSRGERKAEGKLGYVAGSKGQLAHKKSKPYRSEKLELYMKYYDDRAYDHLRDWFEAARQEDHVPIRQRKPFVRLNMAKMMAGRLAAKLVGQDVFPDINVTDDPDTETYLKLVARTSLLQAVLVAAARPYVATGSVYVRFYIVGGTMRVEHYCSNYCYPEFDETGELLNCRVQYIFTDENDRDEKGNPKKKWYRADFGTQSDILYNNPDYKENHEPLFEVTAEVEHGLGFVQGEWFRTAYDPTGPDGYSLLADVIPFMDSINYSLSLSQESTDYNTAPQLVFKGMDEDEVDALIRSNQKSWTLGMKGEGAFLESSMNGVQVSMEMREKTKRFIQDLTRIILLDPDKIVGSAQSGKAMEVLHGPMVDLIGEMRPQFGSHVSSLLMKMAVANLIALRQTGVAPVMVPSAYSPKSLDIQLLWPPVFPMTIQDMQQKVTMIAAAVSNNLISRRTGIKQLAQDFGIEDVEAEYKDIIEQPQLSTPFGMF